MVSISKEVLVQNILSALAADLELLTSAARTAHEAATHEECQPDNKYDTTALEASYLAQGQANRAQEVRIALEAFRTITLQEFDDSAPIRLTALVTLEDEDGSCRHFFLAPHAGGMKVSTPAGDVMVITPASPLGRCLLGQQCGDDIQVRSDAKAGSLTITAIR